MYLWVKREIISDPNRAEDLQRIINVIESRVNALNSPRDRAILKMKYFDGLTWEQISRALGYSETHTKRMGAEALKRFPEPTADEFSLMHDIEPSAVVK